MTAIKHKRSLPLQQLGAGLHTHLWSPVLPKSKSACTCIYQIAGMKKKSSFLLPIFPASERLLRARGGGNVLSPPGLWGGTQAAAWFWLCSVLGGGWQGGRPSSCWKIKEILFCFGMDPRSFEVLGEICWPGQSFSPLSQNFKAAALGCIQGEGFCAAVGKGSPHHAPGPRAWVAQWCKARRTWTKRWPRVLQGTVHAGNSRAMRHCIPGHCAASLSQIPHHAISGHLQPQPGPGSCSLSPVLLLFP